MDNKLALTILKRRIKLPKRTIVIPKQTLKIKIMNKLEEKRRINPNNVA